MFYIKTNINKNSCDKKAKKKYLSSKIYKKSTNQKNHKITLFSYPLLNKVHQ